jgi:osmotically inducible protein OsmC
MKTETETEKGKVIYTARTRTTGGREHGIARSCDGHLDVRLATPGDSRIGTNPEQLLGAAWSACFESAVALAARNGKIALGEVTIDAEIDLHLSDNADYFLSARFNIGLPGIEPSIAGELIHQAIQLCPFSKAIKGNIAVTYNVV